MTIEGKKRLRESLVQRRETESIALSIGFIYKFIKNEQLYCRVVVRRTGGFVDKGRKVNGICPEVA